ncbi:AAA family ATPase [Bacillus cereus]|uniref:AAA family ATPase n=1 Tax=Bacillus cereus TaxID=1396 RepID=UPI000B5EC94E|nr:AAA family ATPase [Bacillus cereus]ASL62713.1 trans-Golgi membrane protein [Bacillus cereus]
MIKKITLKNVATYNQTGTYLDNLKKINFIYGNNGAGKTTISEFIRKEEGFTDCILEWADKKTATYVYNRNFVNENFRSDNPIRGIFTLGKESVEIQVKIADLKTKIRKHEDDIRNADENYNKKYEEKSALIEEFKERCWNFKRNIDAEFKDLIEGYRNSREKFMTKCLEASTNTHRELKVIDDIREKKETLFNRPVEKIMRYSNLDFENELEYSEIFKLKILGKEDVDIAGLITTLNISDWVQRGYTLLNQTDGVCPFCQKNLPNEFEEKLNSYFDQTYMLQKERLDDRSDKYMRRVEEIISQLSKLTKDGEKIFLNKEKLKQTLEILKSKYEENKLLIEQKKKEPSRRIEIITLSSLVMEVNLEIINANKKIDEYNNSIENIKSEKENLVNDMWRYIAEENKTNITQFNQRTAAIEKTLNGLKRAKEAKWKHKRTFEQELLHYQEQVTSVEYSVSEINKILISFGFTNFKLAASTEKGFYKIVRENGEDVKDTLSEGERTFITFLYFYQLLNGSNRKDNIVTDKVVVIDDPISSLDSNVLFMVSSLVRQIMFDIKEGASDVKQLFILTHNIYFHKEITFNQGKKSFGEGSFWIVRKNNNTSFIQKYEENPIKTSYELLWQELKNRETRSLVSIQNVMRRILENYFKFFGNISIDELEDKFELEEKLICRSLISWINDGSHYISEDLYVENNEDIVHRYFDVFKKIFILEGHDAHFNMMLGDYQYESPIPNNIPEDNTAKALDEIHSGIAQVASNRK